MLSAFRNLSKSKTGTALLGLVLVLILVGFAMGDIKSVGSGTFGFSQDTLVKVGSEEVTERDLSNRMKQLLTQLRAQKPDATYADLAKDFSAIVDQMVDEETLVAFAKDGGFNLSKRLVDAEIAKLPAAKDLNGKFSDNKYQEFLRAQQLTDADLRRAISNALMQRMILAPAAVDAKVPMGLAKSYASMLLEQRQGEIGLVPTEIFAAGLNPSDADLAGYYQRNARKYLIPEQRILKFAPINLSTIKNASPTDAEIAAYYKTNAATYAGSEQRVISQVTVPSQQVAAQVAAKAKSGATFVEAAKIAGMSAEDISVGPQTQKQYAALAGDKVASAAFAAAKGGIVGPIQSDLGWHVVKIDDIRKVAGKSLAEARPEIVAKLSEAKKVSAIQDAIATAEDAIDGGANFAEAAAKIGVPVQTSPLIAANGTSRANPAYKLPADYSKALTSGFSLADGDDPDIVQVGTDGGYVMVGLDRIVPGAPAPLASIKQQVRTDWIREQASSRARTIANAIAAKVARGMPMAQALKEANMPLPPVQPVDARRMQIAQANGEAAAPLKMLFTLAQGKSRLIADPQGRGYIIVKTNKIIPGDASTQPLLIAQTQGAFQQTASEELASQFLAAARADQKVKRNDKAITAAKARYVQAN